MYSEKCFSQKAARVMTIGCSVLMIPSLLGLVPPAIGLPLSLVSGSAELFLGCLAILLVGALGFGLFVGYAKHAWGNLSGPLTRAMWILTVIGNSVPLALIFHYMNSTPDANLYSQGGYLIVFPMMLWWSVSVLLALGALITNRTDQKYR